MLLSVALIDWLSRYVYDLMLLVYSLVNIALGLINGVDIFSQALAVGCGLSLYAVIYWAVRLAFKKEAFGAGDVLFLGAIGVVLSLADTILVGLLAFYVAFLQLAIIFLVGRQTRVQAAAPFAPAMALAGVVIYFARDLLIQFMIKLALF